MTFHGIDPRTLGPRVSIERETVSGVPPRALSLVETAAGASFAGLTLGARTYTVRVNIACLSRAGGWETARRLAAWACTDEPAELVPTHTPGRAYTAILQSAGDLQLKRGFGVLEFVFAIPRPFSHSVAESVVQLPGGGRIDARGDVPARLFVSHKLAAAQDALTISADGAPFIRLRRRGGEALPAGAALTVDMARRLVTWNGDPAMDLIDFTATDWHAPIRGATDIRVNDEGRTEIRWRDEWL